MQNRQQHRLEVLAFLQKHFSIQHWELELPKGTGNETYFAHGGEITCFVKLGAQITRYQVMASIGITPEVLVFGILGDGTSILVQAYVNGRKPSRKDYHTHLEQIAATIKLTHHNREVKRILPEVASPYYRDVGMKSLTRLQQRWKALERQVPEVAKFVDQSLAHLAQQVQTITGRGLIASHNDICNANWLITPDGRLYLIDLESMALDDPAVDIGATLWWYYPPPLRQRFLEIVGYANDEAFRFRMQVRMAMHCLSITLPRERSFDRFDPISFSEALTDFRAILVGEDNPQGYED
jgi:thiamine kinase-like enzyme